MPHPSPDVQHAPPPGLSLLPALYPGKLFVFRNLTLFLLFLPFALKVYSQSASRVSFDDGWKFHAGEMAGAQIPMFPDNGWRALTLPHDWSIEGSFRPDNPATNAGASLPGGIGWYRKHFRRPDHPPRHLFIDFDGVYMNSTVWINGHELGTRPSGYTSFRYDLGPFLVDGDNVLAVRVDNSMQPNSRWYSGSGIYRHVWLTPASGLCVDLWGTFVKTPVANTREAIVEVETTLLADSGKNGKFRIVNTLMDDKGSEIVKAAKPGSLHNKRQAIITMQLKVQLPRLWSVESPTMYRLKSQVFRGKDLMDTYFTDFGIRSLQFRPDSGLFVNGEWVKVKGVCMHHDLGCLGAAANRRAMERQLELLKGMGCNAIRTSHNPPAPEFLDLCDRMGFLVMDEAFDVWYLEKMKYDYHRWFGAWHERDLSDMVLRDRNHPSVFLWSIGNEIPEKNHTKYGGAAIATELDGIIKKLDRTRYTTSAFAGVWRADTTYMSDKVDVIGINYTVERYPEEKEKHPNGLFIASETTSSLSDRGIYHFPADSAILPTKDLHCSSFDNRGTVYDRPAARIMQTTWRAVKETPYVAGLFVWTGFDYLGEPAYPYPCVSSSFGIFDLCGFPKDSYYFYKSQWTKEPVLHLFPHWNWKAGDMVDVVAYTNCDRVRLFLNDKLVGEQSLRGSQTRYTTNQWDKIIDLGTGEKLALQWKVPFSPGILRAEGYIGDKLVLRDTVKTSGDPANIELTADRTLLTADGRDLSFVTVRITDAEGVTVPDADNLVLFQLSGKGTVAGVGNGNPVSLEPAKASQRRAFSGLCQLVVQSSLTPGKIVVKASSTGLHDAQLVIGSRNP